MKKNILLLFVFILLLYLGISYNLLPSFNLSSNLGSIKNNTVQKNAVITDQQITTEESAVINTISKAIPSVVTVSIAKITSTRDSIEIDPFDFNDPFKRIPGKQETIEQNIGSGFIISDDGLIVTNKHVVSDTSAEYKIITNDNKTYQVKSVARDPLNDIAILKIDQKGLFPLKLGSSENLKLGQFVIAIGTPLGEFQNTATLGIVSGLGRGITAGSPFEGYVERLDNVIQTDAAINPGNSGGPLLNLAGQVIGINTAVSQEGQNLGFAIPISIVNDLLTKYDKQQGKINRPFLGVRYQIISQKTAVINNLPQGAYILEVIKDSSADKAEIKVDDIITEINGQKLNDENDNTLQKIISQQDIGDRISLKIYRDGKIIDKTIILINIE